MNPGASKEMYTVFKPTIKNIESIGKKINSYSGSKQSDETKKRMKCLLKIISEIGIVPRRRVRHDSNTGTRHMHEEQGRVFQSNPYSFTKQHPLYIVGLNPNAYIGHVLKNGKSRNTKIRTPDSRLNRMKMTIDEHTTWLMMKKNATSWSAYLHEQMGDPDSSSLKNSFLEFFNKIGKAHPGITAHSTPCTNIVFIRTNNETALKKQFKKSNIQTIVDMCWKFHKKALSYVRPKLIMTFSSFAKDILMEKLGGSWIEAFSCQVPLKNVERKCIQYEVYVKKDVRNLQQGSCNIIMYVSHPSTWDWTKTPLCPSTVVEKILSGSLFTTNRNICPATPENVKKCEKSSRKKSRNTSVPGNGSQPMDTNNSRVRNNTTNRGSKFEPDSSASTTSMNARTTNTSKKRKKNSPVSNNQNPKRKKVITAAGRTATIFVEK